MDGFNPFAATEPTAAQPQNQMPATGAGFDPAGTTPTQVVPPGATSQPVAPDASAAPQVPAAPSAPQITPEQYQAAQQKAAQFDQMQAALQQLAYEQQAAQAEQQRQQAITSRLDQAHQTAAAMEPAEAQRYLRQFQERELMNLNAEIRQTEQRKEQEAMQRLAQIAAPLYAQELAQRHQLPPEYAKQLAAYGPEMIDNMLPVVLQNYQAQQSNQAQIQTLMNQINQLTRSQQASGYAATGAHMGGGAGMAPIGSGGNQFEPGSDAQLLSIPGVAQMFGLPPQGS